MKIDIHKLKNSFPFISHLRNKEGSDYLGIIINCDKSAITIIDIDKIHGQHDFIKLMKLSQNWWWYSNRTIPLNLFYAEETDIFMQCLTHLPFKTTIMECGHVASLQKILDQQGVKRKNRTLAIHKK